MKKIATAFVLMIGMFTSMYAQHKFPVSFYFKYPKNSTTVTFFVTRDTVTEGADYYMSNPSKLPGEALRWWNVFSVLTGTHFTFEQGSIPEKVDSMRVVLGNLNPSPDSTQKDFEDLIGESVWFYLEVTVYANGVVYDKNQSFNFTQGKYAILTIPVSPQLISIWQKAFGPGNIDAGFAYVINGLWSRDGAICETKNNEIVVKLPHFSKFGGGGRSLGTTSSVERKTGPVPSKFDLLQNYPNPFNPSTKIKYSIPKDGFVTLKVYNAIGAEVSTLISANKHAGTYEITFNAGNLPSGIYFYSLTLGGKVITNKMMLVK